jgi:hypothetical protein
MTDRPDAGNSWSAPGAGNSWSAPGAPPPYPYPAPGPVPARPVPVLAPPPPRPAARQPVRVEPVPGTPFAVAYLDVPPVNSGPAIGSLVAGIASLLALGVTSCFGLFGAQEDWGGLVAGAFAVPTAVLGGGAVFLGLMALRQIRRAVQAAGTRIAGRGMAIAGIGCGAAGLALVLAVLGLVLAI